MSALVTDIRQLRRRSVKLPPVGTLPLAFETEPVNAQTVEARPDVERGSELMSVLRRMEGKSPALLLLMSTLDLEPVELVAPPGNARLWELAGKSLIGGRTYTRAEAIDAIRTGTGVSQERAETGFSMMVESRAIERANDATVTTPAPHPDLYYLGGCLPF